MEALTPASAEDLPPIGELIVDEPFWRHPAWGLAREGVAHLRIWTTATEPPGRVAVVTETGFEASVTESAGRIWAELVRRYGPSLVLLEHHPAAELSEGIETLDLVRIGADDSPHWSRVWPTPEDNPRHGGLELWMAADGHRIVSRPASEFDRCDDEDDLPSHACARAWAGFQASSSIRAVRCGAGTCPLSRVRWLSAGAADAGTKAALTGIIKDIVPAG